MRPTVGQGKIPGCEPVVSQNEFGIGSKAIGNGEREAEARKIRFANADWGGGERETSVEVYPFTSRVETEARMCLTL